MTQTMYALAPKFFIFGSDGNIRANSYTKQVLGSWKKIEPRKDFIERHRNKHTGHISRSLVLCATRFVKALYIIDLKSFGTFTAYSRQEAKETLSDIAHREGIAIKR